MIARRLPLAVVVALLSPLAAAQPAQEPPTSPPAAEAPSEPAPAAPSEPPTVAPAAQPARPPAAAAPAHAAPEPAAGLTLAVRGAWIKPHGIVASGRNPLPLDFELSSGGQLTLEGGYRFATGITAGLYAKLGVAQPRSSALDGFCSSGFRCDGGYSRKLGVEVLYHFQRERPLSPWIGAGIGYEWAGYAVTDLSPAGGSSKVTYRGFELVDVQAGLDYAVAPRFFLGVFVANSFGRFDSIGVGGPATTIQADIERKAIHDWLQIGVRGRWDP